MTGCAVVASEEENKTCARLLQAEYKPSLCRDSRGVTLTNYYQLIKMSTILHQPLHSYLIRHLVTTCRSFSTTPILEAMPPKKRRRIDPAILKMKVERKISKHEREIDRLENEPKQPIPILEYQHNNSSINNLKSRPGRSLQDVGLSEGDLRAAHRLWNFYRRAQSKLEFRSIRRVEKAQTRALETLKQLDEVLYEKTVTVDDITLIPCTSSQVRKETPPIEGYRPPDGQTKDISKEWVM